MIIRDIEKEIYREIKDLFSYYKDNLLNKNITFDIQLKAEGEIAENAYSSEVEINFYQDQRFFDIIEFFIYYEGELYINRETIIKDLESEIKEIIKRS